MTDERMTPEDGEEELVVGGVYQLTDVDTEEEIGFEFCGQAELDGNTYMAFVPVDDEKEEYVILRAKATEDGGIDLVDIEDDEEFERVADYFDDEIFSDVDYDADGDEGGEA